jgi:3-phosphoshikimate 1-carboxyvinyltransferase
MPLPSPSVVIRPARALRGRLQVPGDKSISHRYAILAALAEGPTQIRGYAPGADCAATLACLERLGVAIRRDHDLVALDGRGARGFDAPTGPLDAANSGTTMRLLAGALAGYPVDVTVQGDPSLSQRPMRRVIEPLTLMGATIEGAAGDRPPLRIRGAALRAIDYTVPVPSAQVKSAILLAALRADGTTIVREPVPTRDHTERALHAFGADLEIGDGGLALRGGQRLSARDLTVPGDLSSAAFFGAAAAALPGSEVTIEGVGLNPTRTAWLRVLERAGARIEAVEQGHDEGEPYGWLRIVPGGLDRVEIAPGEVPSLIDELPALAALATHGGTLVVSGASELRVKESDRISALVTGLRALGADADERSDGFVVRGGTRLTGGTADAAGDHRLAMAFALAALGGAAPSTITGAAAVGVSYPAFFDVLEALRA